MDSATYSPEDNKLRLYVGRVPREEYDQLRAEGWTPTPKQACDFAAVWTPARRARCLQYADLIEDEDQGPEDRAADRAERFGEYRDKRTEEATGHADRYDDQPRHHGAQSVARAERAARRHDRIAGYAVDAWSKAEYWQRRTAGVIAHALHLSSPAVRMGRIKTIEAEKRASEKTLSEYRRNFTLWKQIAEIADPADQNKKATRLAGSVHDSRDYQHPRADDLTEGDYIRKNGGSLYSMLRHATFPITGAEAAGLWLARAQDPDAPSFAESYLSQWLEHFTLRLAYENQMLAAQGGRAAHVEMVAGGWIGSKQIERVHRSTASGRVTSVIVRGPRLQGWGYQVESPNGKDYSLYKIDTERLSAEVYRAPTPEELADFEKTRKAEKKAAPKAQTIPLINPTDEDAERLQALWNGRQTIRKGKESVSSTVLRITQATYSANSKGTFARATTRGLCRNAELEPASSNLWSATAQAEEKRRGPAVCKIRRTAPEDVWSSPDRVIVITDAPQKKLPASVWEAPQVILCPAPTPAPVAPVAAVAAAPLAQAHFSF